jgi:hypothetical protein
MGDKIIVGPFTRGLRNDVTAFNIDNESFPTLKNAYQWRGRIKRKRGTSFLTRLTRYFNSTQPPYNPSGATLLLVNDGFGNGTGNILTGFGLQSSGNIVPGSVQIGDLTIAQVYTDLLMDGTLQGNLGGTGTINYATGSILITGAAGHSVYAVFIYYPGLPVLGLEEFLTNSVQFPSTIAFDTTYSYNIKTTNPYASYDVSFYKNPPADSANLPGYVPKTSITPTTWNGQDYQQFWTTNYQGAMWATNGINVPFSITNIGMQYKFITGVSIITAGNGTTIPAVADLTIVAHGLVQGDFVFINEVNGITGINFQTGYVTSANPQAANLVRVTFPFAILGGAYTTGGIAQYLTNRSDTTKDCLRWYDGDPTDGNSTTPTLNGQEGWVNFAPPLSFSNYSIADSLARQYYLVGARMIVPYKDRLLFLGPVIQTSSAGSQIYLQDTVIYSQNGTPYYTCSFNGDPRLANTVFSPVLTPTLSANAPANYQSANAPTFWEDETGFGGFVSAGVDQPLLTVSSNRDVLITGFNTIQAKLVYSGNDVIPFQFYLINSELGSGSTFSSINLDTGVISRGSRGFILTTQEQATRIDLEIPDEVYQIRLLDNGPERVCAHRDFLNEWIYFTYTNNQQRTTFKFPNQTLQYNYRDNSWAIFLESYTSYGYFRRTTGFTWGTVGQTYPTWASWNAPWNAGTSTLLQTEVIAGNQQGFVVVRDEGTNESNSLSIQNISGNLVTSLNHNLNNDDYIIISGVIGTSGAEVNGRIFQVSNPSANTFSLNPSVDSGTYIGGGLIKRLYVPYIQTKQFNPSWGMSRKTRIGVQQYILTTTDVSQISLLIFLSQNDEQPYNIGGIYPDPNAINNGLIYTTVLYTCPESTNLGLTPANTNLQMPTAVSQQQIWHRVNTSLIGDTVQLGFTMNDDQMRSLVSSSSQYSITNITTGTMTVINVAHTFTVGTMVNISQVQGTIELNGNNYYVYASSPTTVTLDVDSSSFAAYVSGGVLSSVSPLNQFAEIELHGFIIDVSPSQALA